MKNFIISLLLLASQCTYTAAQSKVLKVLPVAARMASLRGAVAKEVKRFPTLRKNVEDLSRDAFDASINDCRKSLLDTKKTMYSIRDSVRNLKDSASQLCPSEVRAQLKDLQWRLSTTRYNTAAQKIDDIQRALKTSKETSDINALYETMFENFKDTNVLARLRLALMKKKNGPRGQALEKIATDTNVHIKELNNGVRKLTNMHYEAGDLERSIVDPLNVMERNWIKSDLESIEAALNKRVALYEQAVREQSGLKITESKKTKNSFWSLTPIGLSSLIGYWLGQD